MKYKFYAKLIFSKFSSVKDDFEVEASIVQGKHINNNVAEIYLLSSLLISELKQS